MRSIPKFFLVILILFTSFYACNDEKKPKKEKSADEKAIAELQKEVKEEKKNKSFSYKKAEESQDDFLSSLNEQMVQSDIQKDVNKKEDKSEQKDEKLKAEGEKETEKEEIKSQYDEDDDGSWAIKIDKRKISVKQFDRAYKRFVRATGKKISKDQFVNVFLQNDLFKRQANWYFRSSKRRNIKDFIKKQAVIENYIKEHSRSKIKTPSLDKLKSFKKQVLAQTEFKNLSIKKDYSKIVNLYKMQMANQKLHLLSQSLKGEFRILQNDEWENEVIEKYVRKEINLKEAKGKKYKDYWLYKILLANKTKKKVIKVASKSNKASKNTNKPEVETTKEKIAESDKTEKASTEKLTISNDKQNDESQSKVDEKDKAETESPNKEIKKNDEKEKIAEGRQQAEKSNKTKDMSSKIKDAESLESNENKKTTEAKKIAKTEDNADSDSLEEEKTVEKVIEKKEVKKDYGPAISYYIKDIENKINLYSITGFNPNFVKSFRKDPNVRMQFLERFLLEELIYRKLKKSKTLYSRKYKRIANQAVDNFSLGYYMKNVLGLRDQKSQQQYFLNYMQKHRIKMSDRYFNGDSKN